MPLRNFEKQTELLLQNLAKGRQIIGRSKILLEDVNTLTILSIENRVQRTGHTRPPKTKSS
jgi:hypothetical protein